MTASYFVHYRKTKNGESLRQSDHISYSCFKELFTKKVTELGFEAAEFGLHSLRAGGTTVVVSRDAGYIKVVWYVLIHSRPRV